MEPHARNTREKVDGPRITFSVQLTSADSLVPNLPVGDAKNDTENDTDADWGRDSSQKIPWNGPKHQVEKTCFHFTDEKLDYEVK